MLDLGISAIRSQVGDTIFEKYIEIEKQETQLFREYFLNRWKNPLENQNINR